jgi:hypothetical protein
VVEVTVERFNHTNRTLHAIEYDLHVIGEGCNVREATTSRVEGRRGWQSSRLQVLGHCSILIRWPSKRIGEASGRDGIARCLPRGEVVQYDAALTVDTQQLLLSWCLLMLALATYAYHRCNVWIAGRPVGLQSLAVVRAANAIVTR